MPARAHPLLGLLAVLLAAALWGTTGTAQALTGGALSALWFGALRLAFAAVFFLAFAGVTGVLARGAWRGLSPGAAIGAGLCMATYNLAFFAGVKLTGVGMGTAIALGSGPIWAGLLQGLIERQPPTAAWWLGTAMAVAGGALLTAGGEGAGASALGVALCLVSGLAYAVYTLLNQRLVGQAPAALITLSAFSVAAAVALPVAGIHAGLPQLGRAEWIATAYTGMVTAGIGYLLYSAALRHIRPATAVTLALVEPVVAFALAVFVLGEPTGGGPWVGLLLVLGGVLMVGRAELARTSG
ncbi:MAG: EamA family transporter [Casimicrobiaceae bacterium]|nr:EamA family transporter [Casimicrobiaceae bacterium]MDW8311990.1 EamA family transporter [Burkholderiales bacterium]